MKPDATADEETSLYWDFDIFWMSCVHQWVVFGRFVEQSQTQVKAHLKQMQVMMRALESQIRGRFSIRMTCERNDYDLQTYIFWLKVPQGCLTNEAIAFEVSQELSSWGPDAENRNDHLAGEVPASKQGDRLPGYYETISL